MDYIQDIMREKIADEIRYLELPHEWKPNEVLAYIVRQALSDKCEINGCENQASRITATDSKYIQVCSECYQDKYKI